MYFGNWQEFLDRSLKESKKDGKFKQIISSSNRKNRVASLRNILRSESWIEDYFKKTSSPKSDKCEEKARKLRLEGNKVFQKRNFSEAHQLYTQCVRFAPWSSDKSPASDENQLCLGFANRSAANYHLKHYKACTEDVDRAILAGYPESGQHKLLIRQAHSLIPLQQPLQAEQVVEKLKILQDSSLWDEKTKATVEKEIGSLSEKIAVLKQTSPPTRESDQPELPVPVHGCSDTLVQASSALQMKWTKEKGRHIVTDRGLVAGDVLLVEQPYAAVLLPEFYPTHCHHCFHKLNNPVPCKRCSVVQYCCTECRDSAWSLYHDIECIYTDLLHSVGVAHLALRVVLVTQLSDLLAHDNLDLGHSGSECTSGAPYRRDYQAVYDLVPHDDHMTSEDLFQYSLTAALLLECISHSQYLNKHLRKLDANTEANLGAIALKHLDVNNHSDGSQGDCCHSYGRQGDAVLAHIGGLLARHLCQLVCNAHAITDLKLSDEPGSSLVHSQSQVRVATAIYPTTSLLNHSCDPSIISSFRGDTLIVRLTKDLKAGDEIYNCYGPHYSRMSRVDRQQILLDQYFFKCECEACKAGTDAHTALQCPQCNSPIPGVDAASGILSCTQCSHQLDLSTVHTQLDQAKQQFINGLCCLENNDFKGAVRELQRCVTLRESLLYTDNRELAECRDALARCYVIKGDFSSAVGLLESTLRTTRRIYGQSSIELANELQKFTEVLVNAGQMRQALDVIDEAIQVFTVNYGPNCDAVKELTIMRRQVNGVLS